MGAVISTVMLNRFNILRRSVPWAWPAARARDGHQSAPAARSGDVTRNQGRQPWKAGGVAAAGRIEAPGGDLHQYGLNGEVADINRARSATAGSAA